MEHRSLGSSNLKVPVLCLGGNIFGYFCNEQATKEIIDYAFEHGINFIDTANVYSNGRSEQFIGKAIKGRRQQFILATKAGMQPNQNPENVFTCKYILQSVEESLQRLGTDSIDLYQVHNFDLVTPITETLQALNQLVDAGKVRYIGCSNYTSKQLRRAISLQFKHRFISIQLPYSILDRRIESKLIPSCAELEVGILAYQSLARGILSGKYRNGKLPLDSRARTSDSVRGQITEKILQVVHTARNFAEARNHTSIELALALVLARAEISSVIIGVRNVQQLKECIKAIEWKLSPAEIREIGTWVIPSPSNS